ncbi:hypothetical protein ACQCSJ_26320, partial [Ralstonia pseudosolanacearum]
ARARGNRLRPRRAGGCSRLADARRNRLYIQRFAGEEDRIALAHEYLHLAFARHPRGQDEGFVEATARRLIRGEGLL